MKDNSVEIQLNSVAFQLKEYHNFDWLIKLGTVFAVFDQQDSGNISFGVEKMGIRNLLNTQEHKQLHMKEQRVMLLKC